VGKRDLQGGVGFNGHALMGDKDVSRANNFVVVEFPRENLKFVEKVGEGQFGEVSECY